MTSKVDDSSQEENSLNARLRAVDLASWMPTENERGLKIRFGVAKLQRPLSIGFYDEWLKQGRHGEMSYLERHRDLKADPTTWLAYARSAIVFAIDYIPKNSDYVTSAEDAFAPRTALYTKYAPENADYHDAIANELQPILQELARRYPSAQFRMALDAEPVLERDLATRAGLGWVGKNTCVIDRNGGSLFFIAEILTSLETDEASIDAAKDYCGTCTRCLDACPTGALVAPRSLDATKCISYWTIEAKKIPPPELREKFGSWYFGCDICQTVCPWNGKAFGRERMAKEVEGAVSREALVRDLKEILESSNRELQRRFEGTPMSRSRGFGLKRNALIVAGNAGLTELLPSIELVLSDEKLATLAAEIKAKLLR